MGRSNSKTVHVQGSTVSVDPGTTVDDLKAAVGAPDGDVATYMEDGEPVALSGRDDVYRTVPEGAMKPTVRSRYNTAALPSLSRVRPIIFPTEVGCSRPD